MNTLRRRVSEWFHFQVWKFRFFPHFLVVGWRALRGRWYYFRDRPLWVVVSVADMPIEEAEDASDQVIAMVREARAELQRRIDQTLRDASAAAGENETVRAEIEAIREQLKKLGD